MVRLFAVRRVGFFLAPGFSPAQTINVQAVLGSIPLNRSTYYAAHTGAVIGAAGYAVVPTGTFHNVPMLDVIIVPDHLDPAVYDTDFLAALRAATGPRTIILAVGNGVDACRSANLVDRITPATTPEGWAVNGQVFTAGPSTGAFAAALAILERLRGRTITRLTELNIEYDPNNHFPAQAASDRSLLDSTTAPGLTVGVLASPQHYAPDVVGALDVFNNLPGTTFRYLWKSRGPVRTALGPTVLADTTFDECNDIDFFVVGATSPGTLTDPDVIHFVQEHFASFKGVIATCAGIFLLGTAGLLHGRTAASNFHMLHLLPEVGAEPSNDPVVADSPLYSAGPAAGCYEAAFLAVADLYGKEVAAHLEHDVLRYRPNAPHQVGSPTKAGPVLTAIAKTLLSPLTAKYRKTIQQGYRSFATSTSQQS